MHANLSMLANPTGSKKPCNCLEAASFYDRMFAVVYYLEILSIHVNNSGKS